MLEGEGGAGGVALIFRAHTHFLSTKKESTDECMGMYITTRPFVRHSEITGVQHDVRPRANTRRKE